jgi:hypothetical protein
VEDYSGIKQTNNKKREDYSGIKQTNNKKREDCLVIRMIKIVLRINPTIQIKIKTKS